MHIFLSDVHLFSGRADDIERRDRLLRFLRQVAAKADALWIGGDLFDFWFEWKHAIPKMHFEVVAELRSLVQSGVPVHMIPGNHDFAIRENFFTKQVGMILHPSPDNIVIDGIRIHWVHGDGVAASDSGYRLLKQILHNRLAQRMFRWIHPDWAMGIALATSKSSRYKSETIGVPPDEEYQAYAQSILSQGGSDVVIMGHTHLPRNIEIPGGRYVNTGDFIIERTYGILENGIWRIERFEYDPAMGNNRVRSQ